MQITNQTIPDLKCEDPERVTPSSDSPETLLSLTLQKLGSRIFRILDISLVRQRTNQKSRKVNSGKIEEGQFARTALFGFAFISQLPELPVDVGSHVSHRTSGFAKVCYVLWRSPDPFRDLSARFLVRFEIVQEAVPHR